MIARRLFLSAAPYVAFLGSAAGNESVDFVREVRPILSAKCYFCHGPDEATREAGLRLDQQDRATEDLGGYAAIAPGNPEASEALVRIRETDNSMRMPPPDSGKSLSEEEIQTLEAWVAQGGEYQPHWAFEPIQRPALPGVDHADAATPIDRFIKSRLSEEGLAPAEPADPYTLIRRVYLDLIGLPPTIEEADAYAADPSDAAYRSVVDRLLSSSRYGERWARRWLDLARYSDTKGYEKDRPRSIWPYRDWVIDAINADMPFDQFTIEQIAGDMLPNASIDQRVATGFHRNTMHNEEGGIDPQEFRFLSIVDRVSTTGATWLGLTIGCAQCHTHKYDPITHTDYYAMFAMLNNSDEPVLTLPSERADAKTAERNAKIKVLRASLAKEYAVIAEKDPGVVPLKQAFAGWRSKNARQATSWERLTPTGVATNLPTTEILDDGSVLVRGDVTNADRYDVIIDPDGRVVSALRLETLPDESLPGEGSGRRTISEEDQRDEGSFLLTELEVSITTGSGEPRRVGLKHASATFSPPGITAQLAIDGRSDTGWTVSGRQRERQELVVIFDEPLHTTAADRLDVTLRHDSFYPAGIGRFRLSVTSDEAPEATGLSDQLINALNGDVSSDLQERRLRQHFLETTPVLAPQQAALHRLRNQRFDRPTTLVMRERDQDPRVTHRHHRGEYLKPREAVAPATPVNLPGFADGESANRLGLARWLVSESNPLTARVIVNRNWEAFFGTGLVNTLEDFGMQGDYPSHPELLDWLAAEFMDSGWSRKQLQRQIVTSHAYRQASTNPDAKRVDPENRLVGRASRLRLEAELVRDTILKAAGLLSNKIGGPSVFPSQPAGITEGAYGPLPWIVSEGEDRYRRGLYTFNKRTAPYAAFGLFDGPSGEVCMPRRDRSNTPLQSLATLNDTVIIEAARAMALSLVSGQSNDSGRANALLHRCLTRPPSLKETNEVVAYVERQRERLIVGELDPLAILNTGPSKTWDYGSDADGWSARNDARLEASEGRLVIVSEGEDPYVGVDVEAPPGRYTFSIRSKQNLAGGVEFYWTTIDEPADSVSRRFLSPVAQDEWQNHRFEFTATAPLTSLRLDLGSGAGRAEVVSAQLIYGDGLVTLSEDDDPIELAAWLLASRAVLNLDEVITRP